MTVFLDRVDAVPLRSQDFSFEFNQWLSVMVDSLNEVLQTIEHVNFVGEKVPATPVDPYSIAINSTYAITDSALTNLVLPDIAAFGAVVRIIGFGSGGWSLAPGAGQTIEVAGSSAAVSIASTSRYDCISIICMDDNTTWVTTSSQTDGFTVT